MCEKYIILILEEDENLQGKRILTPQEISVEMAEPRTLSEEIPRYMIRNKDILLRIQPIDQDITKTIGDNLKISIIEFQFRIFLRNSLTQETLENWKSSSDSWSVDIDIHKDMKNGLLVLVC